MVEIARDTIEQMFADMRDRYRWNVSTPLLWGYYFISGSRQNLERAATLLTQDGYQLVGIFPEDKESDDDVDQWQLHVERVERLTVDSLVERNDRLNAFASANDIESYDGMDVGPAP